MSCDVQMEMKMEMAMEEVDLREGEVEEGDLGTELEALVSLSEAGRRRGVQLCVVLQVVMV